jgi:hypothetical protein
MSSRLAVDANGRAVVVVTTPSLWLRVGERFIVLDWFELGFTRPGRAPTAREQQEAQRHAPYRPALSRREREQQEVPDDEPDDAEAIRAAMLEQRRAPPDLLNVAA